MKKIADDVFERLGIHDERLELAMKLEEIAKKDDYFVERKLYPNVDFCTGLIYNAIGFPTEMFTVLFAIGRLPGWIAQWQEMRPRSRDQDRAPAPDLHRSLRAVLRAHDGAHRHQRAAPGRAQGGSRRPRLISALPARDGA